LSKTSGLGLGFFIAKTLLERSGARIALENQQLPRHGAIVRIIWPRRAFEANPAGPAPPEAVSVNEPREALAAD
jgi:two-component system sensor histidine kinase RegB